MTIPKVDPLLNDQEINYLADLFLSCFKLDRSTVGYRHLRNAVILFSHGAWLPHEIFGFISQTADTDKANIRAELKATLDSLEAPAYEMFNAAYAPPPVQCEETVRRIEMEDDLDLDRTLCFLGTVFLYLIMTNYPKYEYVVIEENK